MSKSKLRVNKEKLKAERQKRNIPQIEMANLLGYAGVQGYSMLETSNESIDLVKAKIIADKFGMTIEELFF